MGDSSVDDGDNGVELLLVRIDHFRDRATYIKTLRQWLAELQIVNGRVISMGSDVQLLFVSTSASQNDQLLEFYKTRPIDTNSRGDLCVDKFIDVLGRKQVAANGCKGFLEMNVLSAALLQKVLVTDWQAEQTWLEEATKTTRTKKFLEWKEAAKAARKQRRKREGQEKQQERDVKRAKREQEEKEKEEEKVDPPVEDEGDTKTQLAVEKSLSPKQQKPQQQQKKAKKKKNHNNKRQNKAAIEL